MSLLILAIDSTVGFIVHKDSQPMDIVNLVIPNYWMNCLGKNIILSIVNQWAFNMKYNMLLWTGNVFFPITL